MARPNYSFEKRQRELKKNRKKEEKQQKKEARKAEGGLDNAEAASEDPPRED